MELNYNGRMFPAIFLDRDGVIIENVDQYVRSWADVVFLEGSIEALYKLSRSNYKIIIVTNQSVIGRGIIPLSDAEEINHKLIDVIERAGARVDGLFMCPHAPADGCSCRKPKPGLILQAASAMSLDLKRSFMIGDAVTDLPAGRSAGIEKNILVKTGRGKDQGNLSAAITTGVFGIYDRLENAVDAILATDSSSFLTAVSPTAY
jgi:histidinol-phosphate phosphatase family protein